MQAKVYYRVSSIIKHSEEDIYKDGCQGQESGNTWSEKPCMQAETVEEIIQRCIDFAELDKQTPDNPAYNACEEDGRLDIQVYEDAEGNTLTEKDIKAWKKGKIKAWLATYSFYIEKATHERVKL